MTSPLSAAQPEVWFVAGYGRSGSTVTASWLGSWLESVEQGPVHSIGELGPWLRSGPAKSRPVLTCSCGMAVAECRHWDDLIDAGADESSVGIERILSGWIGTLIPVGLLAKIIEQRSLFKAQRHLVDHHGVVVDASKTVMSNANAPRIWAALGREVRVVTVTRPRASVLASRRSAFERQGRRPPMLWRARTVTSRFLATILGNQDARRLGGCRIDYDDRPSFDRFAAVIGIELTEDQLGSPPDHMAGGNRMRYASS